MKYLIIDTETGGTKPAVHSLLQWYGVVTNELLTPGAWVDLRIKHDPYIVTAKALEINRIDLVKHHVVAMATADARSRLRHFLETEATQGKLRVVGWNVNFDIEFSKAFLGEDLWGDYCDYHVMDVQSYAHGLARRGRIPLEAKGLKAHAKLFDIDASGHHEAGADVEMTRLVLKQLLYMG